MNNPPRFATMETAKKKKTQTKKVKKEKTQSQKKKSSINEETFNTQSINNNDQNDITGLNPYNPSDLKQKTNGRYGIQQCTGLRPRQ